MMREYELRNLAWHLGSQLRGYTKFQDFNGFRDSNVIVPTHKETNVSFNIGVGLVRLIRKL